MSPVVGKARLPHGARVPLAGEPTAVRRIVNRHTNFGIAEGNVAKKAARNQLEKEEVVVAFANTQNLPRHIKSRARLCHLEPILPWLDVVQRRGTNGFPDYRPRRLSAMAESASASCLAISGGGSGTLRFCAPVRGSRSIHDCAPEPFGAAMAPTNCAPICSSRCHGSGDASPDRCPASPACATAISPVSRTGSAPTALTEC